MTSQVTRRVLHADLDAFYASVEQLDDPSLAGRPVVVGGLGPRGVVAAASYEARRYGVHSAMPMVGAHRACPHGVFLPPRFEAYADASRRVLEQFRRVTPLVEPIALDEAFLDVTGVRRLHGPPERIAEFLRTRVRAETGLTLSVGGASTKLVAKLASEAAKPDGARIVGADEELTFLQEHPVRALWGVGPATQRRLERFGIRTIGDLARVPEEALARSLGAGRAAQLRLLASGIDDRPVEPEQHAKSIGHEVTFPRDLTDRARLETEARRHAELVASRLRAAGRRARTVVLKVRFADFHTITRARTLERPTGTAGVLAAAATAALAAIDVTPGVRLLGVSARNLTDPGPAQEELALGDDERRRGRLDVAVDGVRARFGPDALGPARLVGDDGLRVGRRGSMWGPDDEA